MQNQDILRKQRSGGAGTGTQGTGRGGDAGHVASFARAFGRLEIKEETSFIASRSIN